MDEGLPSISHFLPGFRLIFDSRFLVPPLNDLALVQVNASSIESTVLDPLTPQRYALVVIGAIQGTIVSPYNPASKAPLPPPGPPPYPAPPSKLPQGTSLPPPQQVQADGNGPPPAGSRQMR